MPVVMMMIFWRVLGEMSLPWRDVESMIALSGLVIIRQLWKLVDEIAASSRACGISSGSYPSCPSTLSLRTGVVRPAIEMCRHESPW